PIRHVNEWLRLACDASGSMAFSRIGLPHDRQFGNFVGCLALHPLRRLSWRTSRTDIMPGPGTVREVRAGAGTGRPIAPLGRYTTRHVKYARKQIRYARKGLFRRAQI